MLTKEITWFGSPALLACDGKCKNAWGINGGRPRVEFDPDEPDDYAYLPDHQVGEAPDDPGSYEGGHAKPTAYGAAWEQHRLNRWCARECERSEILEGNEMEDPSSHMPDYSRLHYNMPERHPEEENPEEKKSLVSMCQAAGAPDDA